MSDFSSVYKKTFKQTLKPYGYSLYKNIFYKIVDDNICFTINGKKIIYSWANSQVKIAIDILPYCIDLKSNEHDFQESGYDIINILKRLIPDKLSVKYISDRFDATSATSIINGLNLISVDIKNLILPYIHKFTDLEFYYSEFFKLAGTYGLVNLSRCYINYDMYGLSLKLHKYENALIHIESELLRHNNVIKNEELELIKIRQGDINPIILKKRKDKNEFIKSFIEAMEKTITESEKEIVKLQTIKEALLSKDCVYLDKLVKKAEENSREYIKQILADG